MDILFKPCFRRDADKLNDRELLIALKNKLEQIKKASTTENITGLKLLRGYSNHFRIIVRSHKDSYRMGVIIRKNKIWLVRFLPRKIIYKKFP
jgi:mRNA interferase RelE/StbE